MMHGSHAVHRPHILAFTLTGWLLAAAAFGTTVPGASQRCATFAGSASPIALCATGNYLCYNGALKALVGVSADAACHIPLSDTTVCNLANNKDVLDASIGQTLNKIRLWVSLAGNSPITTPSHTADHPFSYTGTYWRLDIPNTAYFDHLQDVVDYARVNGVMVEITFFAPWEGTYAGGPWDNANGKVCVDGAGNFQPGDANCTVVGHSLVSAGFTTQDQLVRPGNDPTNGTRPRQVQKNLIQWTVDRLYCYDNVYWEIANEPEEGSVDPTTVSQWQAAMVTQTVTSDAAHVGVVPGETRAHLIAANPTNTTIDYINGAGSLANVGLVNGHYTELYSPRGDLGAIQLIRGFGNTATSSSKLLGFNETKISTITGNAGTLPAGAPDSARAEGWEFMVDRGAVYDHWGYNYSTANGIAARTQMKHLKNFISALVLRQLKKSTADGTTTAPAWVSSLPAWGTYNAGRGARLFWAAMDPTATAATKQYVLYLHNSLRRCQSGAEPSCTYLPFNGYQPVIKTAPNLYTETLTLTLPAGTYTTEWIQPVNNTDIAGSPFNLVVNANGSCNGNPNPPCLVTSPTYAYDIALKLTKQ